MKPIVYTSKNCPRCKALKKRLKQNNLSFVEKDLADIEVNIGVMLDLVMRNIVVLSAPVLETENRVFLSDQIFLPNNLLNPDFTEVLEAKNP